MKKEGPMNHPQWHATGLIFENCSCQLVCPGHVSFRQLCTWERCIGHWSIHVDEGRFGEVPLDGLNVVILYDCPQHMFSGNWREVIYIDDTASQEQRSALEMIFTGRAGGPWEVLARFVTQWEETRYLPITFTDSGREKSVVIDGILDTSIAAIRGKDKSREVMLSNMFNQIHNPEQVLALGDTTCTAPGFPFSLKGSHALYSRFNWNVT